MAMSKIKQIHLFLSKLIPKRNFSDSSVFPCVKSIFLSTLRTFYNLEIIAVDVNQRQAGLALMRANGYREKIGTYEWTELHQMLPPLIFPTRFDCEDRVSRLTYPERPLLVGINVSHEDLESKTSELDKKGISRGTEGALNFLHEIGARQEYSGAIVSLWPEFRTSKKAEAKLEHRFAFKLEDIIHNGEIFRLYKKLEDTYAALELLLNYRLTGHVKEIREFQNARCMIGLKDHIQKLDILGSSLLKSGSLLETEMEDFYLAEKAKVFVAEILKRCSTITKEEKSERTKALLFKSGLYDGALKGLKMRRHNLEADEIRFNEALKRAGLQ